MGGEVAGPTRAKPKHNAHVDQDQGATKSPGLTRGHALAWPLLCTGDSFCTGDSRPLSCRGPVTVV